MSRAGAGWVAAAVALMLAAAATDAARAEDAAEALLPLARVFPGAERIGAFAGSPRVAPVERQGRLAGYIFLTSDVVESYGFSRQPIRLMVGLDLDARITAVAVVEHREPILVLGLSEAHLERFLDQYRGLDVRRRVSLAPIAGADAVTIDRVSGASITSLVFNDAIVRSARLVARSRGLLEGTGTARLDVEAFAKADWADLVADGSVRTLRLTNDQVDGVFRERWGRAAGDHAPPRVAEQAFIELHAALATPAAIGQNLIGFAAYGALMAELAPGTQVVFLAANGAYSFKGYGWRRTGAFDRVQIVQGERTLRLTAEMHRPLAALDAAAAPELREAGLFLIPARTGFDATRPWRVELMVERDLPPTGPVTATFGLDYAVPERLVKSSAPTAAEATRPPGEPALWHQAWSSRWVQITLLALGLSVLLVILVFQDAVVRHKRLSNGLRIWFLVYTLFYLGWVVGAQLSVVNVMTFVNALRTSFSWDFFLLEPLTFVLWSFVAVALLFWGRGVFCGWLCPFGALQELVNRIALTLRIPQLAIPFALNERLWPLKYVLFLGLFALSLGSESLTEMATEVEPFKTAIALRFVRAWPFVAYGGMLVAVSLFVQRFFCRYLCPLGAALAMPARNRMFDWLKRRPQCGTECQICAMQCPVQAIHPDGRINLNECIYCLDCQGIYYDDHLCPPLIKRRKRIEERLARQRPGLALAAGGEAAP